MKPNRFMLKNNKTDPIGALVGGIVTALGVLNVPEHLGLTADDVATLGGAIFAVAASVRAIVRSKNNADE